LQTRSDKLLFTPGPLTTSATVKAAMMHDAGSRDGDFLAIVRSIRERLLAIGGAAPGEYGCVLMQGSGTFAIESVISPVLPRAQQIGDELVPRGPTVDLLYRYRAAVGGRGKLIARASRKPFHRRRRLPRFGSNNRGRRNGCGTKTASRAGLVSGENNNVLNICLQIPLRLTRGVLT
jgi:hypothetical protein